MNKWQVLHNFWSGFGLIAYDETSVPDDAQMPYITYSASVSSFEDTVLLTGDIWYYSTSWRDVSNKADEIGEAIGGYLLKPMNSKEFLFLTKGSPFAQRIPDENDHVKRIRINIMGEYFTHG